MQLPTATTPIAKCQELTRYATRMLSKFADKPAVASLGPKLTAAEGMLTTAQQALVEAQKVLVDARVDVRHADHEADAAVRRLLRAAQIADDRSIGRLAGQLFPGGVTPIIKPMGTAELKELRDLEGRLDAAGGSWPEALPEKAKITKVRTAYEAALEFRRTALQEVTNRLAARDAARDDFLDIYAEVGARVKAEFPRDRATQDLFFDGVYSDTAAVQEPDAPIPPAPGSPAT